jgi:hypothetical protein
MNFLTNVFEQVEVLRFKRVEWEESYISQATRITYLCANLPGVASNQLLKRAPNVGTIVA